MNRNAVRSSPSPPSGDHGARSARLLWGNHLVAGLGSHWAGVRGRGSWFQRSAKFHRSCVTTLAALAVTFWAVTASAHNPSKSYLSLSLESNQLTGQWDIPLRDLQTVVPLELDSDGIVTWEKLHARFPAIAAYALAHLKISIGGMPATMRVTATDPAVEEFSDGSYLELPFTVDMPATKPAERLAIDYELFFDVNSLHRGLLRLETNGITQSAVFTPDHRAQEFELSAPTPGRQFLAFLREGVWHIWTGYDHILFLVALLLPSVLQREAGRWREVAAFRPAFMNILKIVTAFTVAHSLTLSLATLGIVRLPSRLTESTIAASVVLAAANDLWPIVRERGWIVAFGFGLVHGFGFATALSDLGLVHGAMFLTLVGFNLGVEVGQLAIVGVFLPVAFGLRRMWVYQVPLLRLGSVVIMLVAGTWLAERVFDFKVLPF
jgi:HupE / UreJ protein